MMLLKCYTHYASKFGKCSSGKRSIFNTKECSDYRPIALISHASKVMLKILQVRLQLYVNQELPDIQARLRKNRGIRDQIANTHYIIEKASSVQFSHSVMSDSLQPHELQHARLPGPSLCPSLKPKNSMKRKI